jgi:hypothetical protein
LSQGPSIVPIPGTRRLTRLDEAPTQVKVVGDRYPEAMQRMVNRSDPRSPFATPALPT